VSSQQESTHLHEALWQPGNTTSTFSQLPFIVPAVLEHLEQSVRSPNVYQVPGEADSYCAAAAYTDHAAVLTNDSDLILYDDMQDGGVVILLNSLVEILDSMAPNDEVIRGTCWRPTQITAQLGIKSMMHLGFERLRNPSCSFLTVVQHARGFSADEDTIEFPTFAKQYESTKDRSPSIANSFLSLDLKAMDPRLTELVVQLEQTCAGQDSDLHIYFPILHEDPNRDTSWAYGGVYRQLAYSILYQHSISQQRNSDPRPENVFVAEFMKKGQRIAQENVRIFSRRQLLHALQKELDNMRSSPWLVPASIMRQAAATHLLRGLHLVLTHRLTNEKQQLPSALVAQFLGLTPIQPMTRRTFRPQTNNAYSNGWALLHLNANVQAVLYSIRMLKQSIDYVLSQDSNPEHQHINLLSVPSDQADEEIEDTLFKLQKHLSTMPSIQALFLHPADVARCMQKLPREDLKSHIVDHLNELGVDLSMFFPPDESPNRPESKTADVGAFEEVNKKRKRKKKPKVDASSQVSTATESKKVRNIFDVLQGR